LNAAILRQTDIPSAAGLAVAHIACRSRWRGGYRELIAVSWPPSEARFRPSDESRIRFQIIRFRSRGRPIGAIQFSAVLNRFVALAARRSVALVARLGRLGGDEIVAGLEQALGVAVAREMVVVGSGHAEVDRFHDTWRDVVTVDVSAGGHNWLIQATAPLAEVLVWRWSGRVGRE